MPFTFIIVGAFLIITSARGKAAQLFCLLKGDLISGTSCPDVAGPGTASAPSSSNTFLPWMVSILVIGGLGYIPQLRTFSRMFLVLLIVVLFLANKGFFAKLQADFPQLFGKTATGSAK